MHFNYDWFETIPLAGKIGKSVYPHVYLFENIDDFSRSKDKILVTPECNPFFMYKHQAQGLAMVHFFGRILFNVEGDKRASIADLSGSEDVLLNDIVSDSGHQQGLSIPDIRELKSKGHMKFSEVNLFYKPGLPGLVLRNYSVYKVPEGERIRPERLGINDGTGHT